MLKLINFTKTYIMKKSILSRFLPPRKSQLILPFNSSNLKPWKKSICVSKYIDMLSFD
jgi:hypothetical protein